MVTRREANLAILSSAVLAAAPGLALAQTPPPLELPPPRASGGKPLFDALKRRRSMRDYADRPLPAQRFSASARSRFAAYGRYHQCQAKASA